MDKHVIDWLCEAANPAIQSRTTIQLLGAPASSPAVEALIPAIWGMKDIQKMLQRQNADGIWEHNEREYGVHTSLRYLTAFAEYGLHQDARLDRAVEYTIRFLVEKETADLSQDYSGCSNALLLRAMVMLGYHQNPQVKSLLDKYAASQLSDGGFICRRLLAKKPARKSCYKAALAGLLLYAECAQKNVHLPGREQLLGYFLKRDVFYAGEDKMKLLPDGNPGWRGIDNFFPVETMRIGLPLTMAALAVLGAANHPALSRGWSILATKKNETGRYILEGTLTRQPCKFGKVGEENKWVTFYALLAEKHRNLP
jgi:hypothetical protein